MNIDLNLYTQFVEAVTSKQSNEYIDFSAVLADLQAEYINEVHNVHPSLLITSALGMCGESGEFSEIVKKILFQGKKVNSELEDHMIKELGDIIFYWITACRSLNIDPNVVIERNVDKLQKRYPGGMFDVHSSENRKEGDV